MTVGELIKELVKLDPESPVHVRDHDGDWTDLYLVQFYQDCVDLEAW